MTQTVLNISFTQNLLATAGFGKNFKTKRRLLLTFLTAFVSYIGMAQTYTTKADGAWNSTSTWVNGVVPAVGAGKIVNIKHDVTYNLTTDFAIAGTLNIEGDTLRFPASYDKKVLVAATGIINVKNGGFLQNVPSNKSEMEISGGRIILENAKFSVAKTLKALAGTRKTYKNSTVQVGSTYEIDGTSASRSVDSIQASTVEVGINDGDFDVKAYSSLKVANAKITVGKGNFKVGGTSDVAVLPNAATNYGFNLLKIEADLQNDGAWDARIDAFCIGKDVKGSKYAEVDFTRPEDCNTSTSTAPAPELSFINPVLKSGNANKEGAVYRFSNITPGVDAEIKIKKFSRSDIVMKNFDNGTLGWNKAFQPEFGLPGLVAPFQNWYVDFEMTFYEAGKTKKKKVEKADFTALDVDGDGYSIAEYAMFTNPSSVAYSTVSSLSSTPAGSLGSLLPCPLCLTSSALIQCNLCQGVGHDDNDVDCGTCTGNGVIHSGCSHPFEGIIGNVLQGPVQNYNNIDTAGTAVMATYQFQNVDRVTFRYGAKSGAYASNGSGIRLNSMWSKSFALTPMVPLPVNFAGFAVLLEKGDASITWKSVNGEEVSHFVVQRSNDGKHFSDIATVLPDGTTAYTYSDKAVTSATGVVYYRVVSVDFTKEQQYTDVKQIRLTKNDLQSLAIATYPNPVVNDLKISLPNTWQGKPVMLQLYTANGTIAKSIQLGSASQTEAMSIAGLTKGLYIVKAICGDESAQQRVIKQ